MSANLTEIKERLFVLGVSTSTPGLAGTERLAELQRRLEIADTSNGSSALDGVAMSEIRSRLTDMGESTSTPGLVGEERRAVLVQRLVSALKSSDAKAHGGDLVLRDDHYHASAPGRSEERKQPLVEAKTQHRRNDGRPPVSTPGGAGASAGLVDMALLQSILGDHPPELAPAAADLGPYGGLSGSELRREHKNMLNRRAVEFAARLSGPGQDPRLRDCSKLATKIATELTRLKELRRTSKFGSSVLVNGGAMMAIEDQLGVLEQLAGEARDRVRAQKQRIKEEVDAHLDCGLLAEERLLGAISTQKQQQMVGGAGGAPGRLRRRVQELKRPLSNTYNNTTTGAQLGSRRDSRDKGAGSSALGNGDLLPGEAGQGEGEDFLRLLTSMELDVFSAFADTDTGQDQQEQLDLEEDRSIALAVVEDAAPEDSTVVVPRPGEEQVYTLPGRSGDREAPPQTTAEESEQQRQQKEEEREKEDIAEEEDREGAQEAVHGHIAEEEDREGAQEAVHGHAVTIPSPAARADTTAEAMDVDTGEAEGGAEEEGGSEDDDDDDEDALQIRALCEHAVVLEALGDLDAAEAVLLRALDVDPLHPRTLARYATFLHRRRGELARAESFFRRALQVCLPGLLRELLGEGQPSEASAAETHGARTERPAATGRGLAVHSVVSLLTSYASFLQRKGDVEAAGVVLRRAAELAPGSARVLSLYAHFLMKEGSGTGSGESDDRISDLLGRAPKLSPGSAQICLWHATFLRKRGRLAEAEVMFIATIQHSSSSDGAPQQSSSIEPTAICNFATFLYRQKKDVSKARRLFALGLRRFPAHKGLRRNYRLFLRETPPAPVPPATGPPGQGQGSEPVPTAAPTVVHVDIQLQQQLEN